MPVPANVIFAKNDQGVDIYYADVRRMGDDERIAALKSRLDKWLIGQIDELGKDEGGTSKVYSPFPLALLTCVAIATLAAVMYDEEKNDGKSGDTKHDTDSDDKRAFITIAKKIDVKFSRPFQKPIKDAIAKLWEGTKDAGRISTPADLLYTFCRNSLIHRYQGLGVHITEEATRSFAMTEEGTMVLDPYWLWRQFKRVYQSLFDELHANPEPTNTLRKSALRYIARLIA